MTGESLDVLDYFPPAEEVVMPHKIEDFTGPHAWSELIAVPAETFRCSYCSADIGASFGWRTAGQPPAVVRVCPLCNAPTFFDIKGVQWPGAKAGQPVGYLPEDVKAIYEEARSCVAANAPSGAAMLCRKILMHVAVEKGARSNRTFKYFVKWLIDNGHAPRSAEVWLRYVRDRANDVNHEIMVMSKEEAEALVRFTQALLSNVYELPSLVPTQLEEHSDEGDPETPTP